MNVLITGSSSGLGREMYRHFKNLGHNVIGVSTSKSDINLNLGLKESRDILARRVKSLTGRKLDLFINNAGVLLLNEYNFQESMKMLQINLVAVWDLIELFTPIMTKNSNIINISSISGLRPDPDTPLYGATKAGVISLTKSYAKKFSRESKRIRVNSIAPGFFKTNLVPGKMPKELLNECPFKRVANPKELIAVVEMIINHDYITGTVIPVDGGSLLW